MATPPPGPMTPLQPIPATQPHQPLDPATDPSMEDILASIRRILNEDEAPKSAPEPSEPTDALNNAVLVLDSSMMVPEPQRDIPQRDVPPKPAPERSATLETPVLPDPELSTPRLPAAQPPAPVAPDRSINPSLVAPEAAAAAGASVELADADLGV